MANGLQRGGRDFLELGSFNVMCAYCGRKRKANEVVRDNEFARGLWCCPEHADQRHPQDFARGVPEKMAAPFIQPPIVSFTSQAGLSFPLSILPNPVVMLSGTFNLLTESGFAITTESGVPLGSETGFTGSVYATLPSWISPGFDPVGVYVTNIQWSWLSGGTSILIGSPNALATLLTTTNSLASGVLQVQITDSLGGVGTATVKVSVSGTEFVTIAPSPLALTLSGPNYVGNATATLNGGTPVSYSWSWLSGGIGILISNPTSVTATFTAGSNGSSGIAQCVVTDNHSVPYTQTVSVSSPALAVGANWTNRGVITSGGGAVIVTLATDGVGNVLAIDENGLVYRSVDGGVTWLQVSTINDANYGSTGMLSYGNGAWICGSGNSGVYRSTNTGTSWTFVPITDPSDYVTAYTDGAGKWIAWSDFSGTDNYSVSTDNGLTWTNPNTFNNNGMYPGSVVFWDSVAAQWELTQSAPIPGNTLRSISATSPDGATWTQTAFLPPPAQTFFGLMAKLPGGLFVVPVVGGAALCGAAWSDIVAMSRLASTGIDGTLIAVGAGGTKYHAFDGAGLATSSTDTTTWVADNLQGSNGPQFSCAMVYDPVHSHFMIGDDVGRILTV